MPVTTAEGIFEELKKIPLKTLSFCVSSQFLYLFSFFVQLNCAFVNTYYISQPSRGVPRNRCSENRQQIYRRTPVSKCDFVRNRTQAGCSPVNLLRIFRTSFLKNTSGWLLLYCSLKFNVQKYPCSQHEKSKQKCGFNLTE